MRLVAVFDQFHDSIAPLNDPRAEQLAGNWASIRNQYVSPGVALRSALVAGMEQGLREMPMLLRSLRPEVRKLAASALATAITTHYPDLLIKDAARFVKIMARGSIRGDDEYRPVRLHVDLLEGERGREEDLQRLYELVDRYEARAREA